MANAHRKGRSWAQVASCCILCAFAFALPLPCFGVFISPMVASFQSSVTDVNLYFLFLNSAAVVSCAFGTRLLVRHMRATVAACSAAMTAGYLLLAAFPSVAMVWTAGIVAGICYPLCSSVLVPIVINQWFEKGQGTLVGISFGCVGIAGVAFGPVLAAGISLFGWRLTLAAATLVMELACGVVAAFLLRPAPKGASAVPAALDAAAGTASAGRDAACAPPAATRQTYFGATFAFMAVASVLSGVMGDMNTQINAIAQLSGFDPAVAALAFSCISAGLLVGKIALGWLKDRCGALAAIAFGCLLGMASFTCIGFAVVARSAGMLYVGAAVAGICTCLGTVAPALLSAEAYRGADRVRAVGHATAFCNVGMALGAPVFSLCFDAAGTYLPVVFGLCPVALCTVLATWACLRGGRRETTRPSTDGR
ncbi:MFS transporter [Xiamenia xianingshaonis]|uniref:MFS transporter n=1 Tax=Xiamenia xianingshaonis TaxID=2682776 RepID=A0A9E6SUE7_9ACTN|nr:MFS transporter [Xiamenia xianingshaonis]NHM14231.1 MFS transporter [Xiamenia xianingshaonis]QTU84157.1 MFS transporter [Xiamenia xianingshaonis]